MVEWPLYETFLEVLRLTSPRLAACTVWGFSQFSQIYGHDTGKWCTTINSCRVSGCLCRLWHSLWMWVVGLYHFNTFACTWARKKANATISKKDQFLIPNARHLSDSYKTILGMQTIFYIFIYFVDVVHTFSGWCSYSHSTVSVGLLLSRPTTVNNLLDSFLNKKYCRRKTIAAAPPL